MHNQEAICARVRYVCAVAAECRAELAVLWLNCSDRKSAIRSVLERRAGVIDRLGLRKAGASGNDQIGSIPYFLTSLGKQFERAGAIKFGRISDRNSKETQVWSATRLLRHWPTVLEAVARRDAGAALGA